MPIFVPLAILGFPEAFLGDLVNSFWETRILNPQNLLGRGVPGGIFQIPYSEKNVRNDLKMVVKFYLF